MNLRDDRAGRLILSLRQRGVTDPRVLTLPAAAQTAFDASNRVVIETTDVLEIGRAHV